MDDKEDFADESPQALDRGPADPPGTEPQMEQLEVPLVDPPDEALTPPVGERKPGLYLLRPRGLRPAPRSVRNRSRRLRNDCPPDQRRLSDRPSPKPRLR